MSGLVSFDPNGAFGPAVTLIYNAQNFSKKGLYEVVDLLKENFTNLSSVKPKGKTEFCAFVLDSNETLTPKDIISTRFFQNMQKESTHHQKILEHVVPCMMKAAKVDDPTIQKWAARFFACYLTEDQINKISISQSDDRTKEERSKIGKDLYEACVSKKLTAKDFDAILAIGKFAMQQLNECDHSAETLNFSGRYLQLFAMNKDPAALGNDVLTMLETNLKQKMF